METKRLALMTMLPAPFQTAPAPEMEVFDIKTDLLMFTIEPALRIAPPPLPVLFEKVLSVTVRLSELNIAPPELELAALPTKLELVMVRMPPFKMAPPLRVLPLPFVKVMPSIETVPAVILNICVVFAPFNVIEPPPRI